jgi:hypothetical protein
LVDKINSSTSKSTVDTKGIDAAIRKLDSLKKKQQELMLIQNFLTVLALV